MWVSKLSFHSELEWGFWFGLWLGWNTTHYRTRAIITHSWFETTLDYKPRILCPKIEEFPCLVHNTPIHENFIYKKQGPSPISLLRVNRIFSKAKTLKKIDLSLDFGDNPIYPL